MALNGRTAQNWLKTQMQSVYGESVTYTRGADSATVTALVGFRRDREEAQVDSRLIVDGEPMDFLIAPGDLVVGGSAITPARGDRITWDGKIYDVQPMDGEPASRDSGYGHLLRIHTYRKT